MRYLSVCSGIEAASVAWEPLGWTPEAFSEIEAFPAAVLAHHWPDVPNLGDFTTITPQPGHNINVLVGGTPCQGFSVAGLRGSLSDDRSNLCLSFVRLAHALRATGPLQYVVWENVPGVLSTDDNAFGCFLGGLSGADDAVLPSAKPPAGKSTELWTWKRDKDTGREFHVAKWHDAGMVAGPRARLAWRVLDAQHHGLAQRRRRVFVVAGFGEDTDPAAVLFEPRRMCGHSPEGRKQRQSVARPLGVRPSAGGKLGDGSAPAAFGGNNASGPINVATTLTAKGGGRTDGL
jgi:DNA (cytosine-5)-methyltransferase 1